MKTVFIPPIVNWNFLKQLPQQMAEQFSKNGYRVLYCNERSTIDLKKVEVKKNLIVYPNFEYALYEIERQKIKIDIFYTTAAITYKFIEKVKPEVVLYHSCDSFDQWKPIEHKIIKAANIIFCTSQFIYNMRKKQHDKVYLVENGCNENMIGRSVEKTESFKFIKRPICVFSGACGWWVSTFLIRNVAKEFYTILVGHEFGKKVPDNVQMIKAMDHDKLVNYLYNMDIGLLPFNTKLEVTQAANPIKLWEYLACGLPVIATDWVETNREDLENVVYIAKKDEDFVELIDEYSKLSYMDKLHIKEECFKIARQNTWEKRFLIIKNSLHKIGVKA